MKLSVLERMALLSILPKEGSFTNLRLMRQLREECSFSEEENKILNFRQKGELTQWNNEPNLMKDIEIGETMSKLIADTLKEMDKREKLTNDHFSLYEKFVMESNINLN